jgi:hypothetical protein
MTSKVRTLPVRLDPETYKRLALQAKAEGVSMNEVVKRALGGYFESRPIERSRLLELAQDIVSQDADLLDALRKV